MFDTRRQSPQRAKALYEGEDDTIDSLVNRPPQNRTDAEAKRREYAINRGSTPATGVNTNPNYPGLAEQFNEQQYGVRNPTVEYRQPTPPQSGNFKTTDNNGVSVTYGSNKKRQHKYSTAYAANQNYYPDAPTRERRTSIPRVRRKSGKKRKHKSQGALKVTVMAAHRLKALAVALWSSAWAVKVWLVVQAPLAVLSIIGLGVWYYIEYLKSAGGQTFLGKLVGIILRAGEYLGLGDFANAILKYFGWDLPSLESLFFIAYAGTFVFGFLVIFMTLIAFTITFNRPLSGKMAALKWGTLALCIVGYAIPGLNLFPWILLYIWVVALYPR